MNLSIRNICNRSKILENAIVVILIANFMMLSRNFNSILKTWWKYRKYMIEGFCNIYFDANKGAYRRNDTSVAIDA